MSASAPVLIRLLAPPSPGAGRRTRVRGAVKNLALDPALEALAPGSLALASWREGALRLVAPLRPAPWPYELGDPDAWPVLDWPVQSCRLPLLSYGTWTVDPQGAPVELGSSRFDGERITVVNLAGWRLSDLQDRPLPWRMGRSGTTRLALLLPEAVPAPPESQRPAPAPVSERRAMSLLLGGGAPLPAPPLRPPTPPPRRFLRAPGRKGPGRLPFDRHLAIDEVRWLDDAIEVPVPASAPIRVPLPGARAAFEPLKEEVAAEVPRRIHVQGELVSGRPVGLRVLDAPSLGDVFSILDRVRRKKAVARVRAGGWRTTGELCAELSGAEAEDAPERIFEDPDLRSSWRHEAVRWLFSQRDREARVLVWRDEILLVPLRLGERRAWVWERGKGENATYVFFPEDDRALAALKALGSEAGPWRKKLLRDRGLQRYLGFAGRAIHAGPEEDPSLWQDRLLEVLTRGAGLTEEEQLQLLQEDEASD